MKTYWLNHDKEREDYFKTYAAAFDRTLLSADAMITLVCENDEVCGFSALTVDDDIAYILFFLVFEEYRRRGYGSFLLGELSEKLSEAGILTIHAIVPSDEGICAFFEKEGFEFFPGEGEYEISFGEVCSCEKYRKDIMGQPVRDVVAFKDCTPKQKDVIREILKEHGITEPRGYDLELSMAGHDNGRVDSILLCERINGGIIIRMMIISETGKPKDLLYCLRALNDKLCAEEGSASMMLSFPTDVSANLSLIEYLTGLELNIEEYNRGYIAIRHTKLTDTAAAEEAV